MSNRTRVISSVASPSDGGRSSPVEEAGLHGLSDAQLRDIFKSMYTIRRFEVTMERAHLAGDLYGPFHSSMGQEAVPVGVCAALRADDVVTSTHRGHGHAIAKGAELGPICAELWGRATGYCGGKGGSMHIVSTEHGFIGQSPIIGGSGLLATGAALCFDLRGESRVAVAFLGTARWDRGCFTRRSIWRPSGVYLWCSWWRTMDTPIPSGRIRCR